MGLTQKNSIPLSVFISPKEDRLLRLYAQTQSISVSDVLRSIIVQWGRKQNEGKLTTSVIELVKKEWEMQQLKNEHSKNPVLKEDFITQIKKSLWKLPYGIVKEIIEKAFNETDNE